MFSQFFTDRESQPATSRKRLCIFSLRKGVKDPFLVSFCKPHSAVFNTNTQYAIVTKGLKFNCSFCRRKLNSITDKVRNDLFNTQRISLKFVRNKRVKIRQHRDLFFVGTGNKKLQGMGQLFMKIEATLLDHKLTTS